EDGIRDFHVTGVQTCALPISKITMLKIAATTAFPRRFRPELAGRSSANVPSSGAAITAQRKIMNASSTRMEATRSKNPKNSAERSEERREGKSGDREGRRIKR